MKNQYQAPQPQYGYQPQPQMTQPGKGLAIGSMVLGIVGLVIGLLFSMLVGIICGIVGIILAAVAKKKGFKGGMATAGLVLSIITVAVCLIVWIAAVACVASLYSGLGY